MKKIVAIIMLTTVLSACGQVYFPSLVEDFQEMNVSILNQEQINTQNQLKELESKTTLTPEEQQLKSSLLSKMQQLNEQIISSWPSR